MAFVTGETSGKNRRGQATGRAAGEWAGDGGFLSIVPYRRRCEVSLYRGDPAKLVGLAEGVAHGRGGGGGGRNLFPCKRAGFPRKTGWFWGAPRLPAKGRSMGWVWIWSRVGVKNPPPLSLLRLSPSDTTVPETFVIFPPESPAFR